MNRMVQIVCAVSVIVVLCGMAAAGEKVTVAGSSTVRPVVSKAARLFEAEHSGVSFAIGGGGSSKGVKLAGSGEVMLGMASRGMKDKEKAKYPDLVPVKIGVDGIAVIVNKSNPVESLTKQQVADIYAGKIANWKQLGGKDAPIALTAMGSTHGTHSMFLKYFGLEAEHPGGDKKKLVHKIKGSGSFASVAAKSVESSREGMAAVMTNPKAIGYVSIGPAEGVAQKGGPLKLLKLDGVEATKQTVSNGSYPLTRSLYLLTKGQPTGVVKEFIAFVKGPKGQKIVAKEDYIPVK